MFPETHVQAYYQYIDPEGHIKLIAEDEETEQLTLITDFATSASVVARAEITMEVRYTNPDDLLVALKHAHDMRFGITDIELGEGRVH